MTIEAKKLAVITEKYLNSTNSSIMHDLGQQVDILQQIVDLQAELAIITEV